jgi:hypothetical protein
MQAYELIMLWAGRAVLLVMLAGLVVRRRVSECYSFVAYAVIVLVCGPLMALWPSRFWTKDFWLLRQALYDAAKMVVSVELAWRVFRPFPGAMRAARGWALVVLPMALLLIASLPSIDYSTWGAWQPRMMMGCMALFAVTASLSHWYNLPVRPWHRALILGFSGYLVVFTLLLQVLRNYGWVIRFWYNLADSLAYLALIIWWAVEAWRPDPLLTGIPLSVQQRLGLVGQDVKREEIAQQQAV